MEQYTSSYVEFVCNNFNASTRILEIGAGYHSTNVFSKYFAKVHSIENNQDFIGLYNSNYIHCELNPITGWYENDQLRSALTFDYDLIILDGPEGLYRPPFLLPPLMVVRAGFFYISWPLWKKGIPIIIDDTDRPWIEKGLAQLISREGYQLISHNGFSLLIPNASVQAT